MRPPCLVLAAVLLAPAWAPAAQDLPLSLETFAAATTQAKRDALATIKTHSVQLPPVEVVALLDAGLDDADDGVRTEALQAIASHTVGQLFLTAETASNLVSPESPGPATDPQWLHDRVNGAWPNERPLIVELRPQVVAALSAPERDVRRDAVKALLAIGFDPEQRRVTLSEQTVSDLAALYRRESEAWVRDEIVKSFALGQEGYPELRLVLLAALDDPDGHVRQYALMGAARLRLREGLSQAMNALREQDSHTRFLAARALVSCRRLECQSALETALALETDPVARGEMERVLADLRDGRR